MNTISQNTSAVFKLKLLVKERVTAHTTLHILTNRKIAFQTVKNQKARAAEGKTGMKCFMGKKVQIKRSSKQNESLKCLSESRRNE